jgi:hypothetical protein
VNGSFPDYDKPQQQESKLFGQHFCGTIKILQDRANGDETDG